MEEQLPVTIRTGGDAVADLTPEELRQFAMEQAEALYDPPEMTLRGVRNAIAEVITPTFAMRGGIRGRVQQVLDWIHPKPFRQYAERRYQWMKEAFDSGIPIVASIGQEKAGFTGCILIGKTPDEGRNVYDIGQVVVLKKFRGRGIFPQMVGVAKESICTKSPDALIIMETRSERVVAWCLQEGFREYPSDKALELLLPAARITPQMRQDYIRRNWRLFVFDPREHRKKNV